MRARWTTALLALALTGQAMAAEPRDRLERFRALAREYAEAAEAPPDGPLLSHLLALVDDEVMENLRSGGPFASTAFIQERLDAFSDEWGGAAFRVTPAPRAREPLLVGVYTVTRGEPRGSLRVYGRANGAPAVLAAETREGSIDVRAWPVAPGGAPQFLASWVGVPTGRGARSLHLELWRQGGRDGVTRVWNSAEAIADGLRAFAWTAKDGRIAVRYEVRYPGWKPGCAAETEQEDVFRPRASAPTLGLVQRRVLNGWHRELHSTVTRFFGALDTDDGRALADLVPDASLRARLPRDLHPEAVCDERRAGTPATVLVAATQPRDRVAWSLSWRRDARGWRLAAAAPVLQ